MPFRAFTSARIKPEATRGAGGTPTKVLNFTNATHTQDVATVRPEELGSYFAYKRASAGTETNSFEFEGNLDFSTLPYWAGLFVNGTAAATGGTPWQYTFTPSGTADNLDSWVLEMGDTGAIASGTPGVKVSYILGNELTLRFAKSPTEPGVTYTASLLSSGTATQLAAFTGSPTEGTAAFVATNATQVYIDASTIGNTADSNVTEVEFTLQNNPVNLYTLNNSAAAQGVYRPNPRNWSATITRYYANDNEWDVYQSKAERKVRVLCTGPTYGTATYKFQLDLYGVYTGREMVDVDGFVMERLTLEPFYDTTATTDFAMTVFSDTSSIA